MGLFSRRAAPAATHTIDAAGEPMTATGTNNHHHETNGHHHEKSGRSSIFNKHDRGAAPRHHQNYSHNGPFNRRPSFGQWLKATWIDLLTMVAMGLLGLGIYEAKPAPSRSFAVYFQDGQIVTPEYAFPLRNEIVPIWAAAMLGVLVPIVVFLICQIRVRSFMDVNNAVIGLIYAVETAAVFQVFLKWLIGGFRPHFLDVCKPAVPINGDEVGDGFRQIYYRPDICTGDQKEINDSLESFPSGHTTAAFAGFVYLYLYLNAKLKVWSNYHPEMWKLVAIYAPVLGATLIGGALTIDEYHNWWDILAGAVIGTMFAFSGYRMVYASVWDFRFNHIPLHRNVPFTYGAGPNSLDGFHDAIFTRKAGWGTDLGAAHGGAPFDAADGPSGTNFSVGGMNHGTNGVNNGINGDGHYEHHGHHGRHGSQGINRRPVPGATNHMGENVV